MPLRCVLYTIILVGGLIWLYGFQSKKCEAAGGIYAPNICVNPSAIIEMD